jgi:uncharacterized protein (TIGR03067 family)
MYSEKEPTMIRLTRSLIFILMCLASVAAVRGDDDKTDSGDLKKMQGAWIHTNAQGEEYPWVFEGDVLKSTVGHGTYTSKMKLDPKAKPQPTIDLKITEAPDDSAGKTALAIYKFDGDTLTLCFALPGTTTRPTEFQRSEGEFFLIELKRAK